MIDLDQDGRISRKEAEVMLGQPQRKEKPKAPVENSAPYERLIEYKV